MIPGDIKEIGTEGEKAFYKFLEGVAKQDAHYLCWCMPDINGGILLGHSVIDLLGILGSLCTT